MNAVELIQDAMHGDLAAHTLSDFDGVFCVEFDGVEPDIAPSETLPASDPYYQHVSDADPLYVPTKKLLGVVTGRLHRYRPETQAWMDKYGVTTIMGTWMSFLWRHCQHLRRQHPPVVMKATVYQEQEDARLFVESKLKHAIVIAQMSKKQVFCTENNELLKP